METNLETLPIGEDAPRLLNAVVEVPVGSRNKCAGLFADRRMVRTAARIGSGGCARGGDANCATAVKARSTGGKVSAPL